MAVKKDGKFVAFDNDADYSGLANERQLYYWTKQELLLLDESDEELKTIAYLVQQYLRDKSKIREHEFFIPIDKAYYNWSNYITGDYYLQSSGYHCHRYMNGKLNSIGDTITYVCRTPSKYEVEGELQTLDGEIVPDDALVLRNW